MTYLRMKHLRLSALAGVAVIVGIASVARLRPRPTRLAVTSRAGDDTVVVNQTHRAQLNASVLDQFGRRLRSDTTVRYEWVRGDSIRISSDGKLQCSNRREAVVRATFQSLRQDFVLRCRPVAWIEASTWMDLFVGDSTRNLSFVAHGPDGRPVTELRGAITVPNGSIVAVQGTTVRPMRPGATVVDVQIGNAAASIPIVVYTPVMSFVNNPQRSSFMAMRVDLARDDTIMVPVPKAAFWVTYVSGNPNVAPPTILLVGVGECSTGNGLRLRRVEDGEYAKYCLTGNGARLMIAHGAAAAARIVGNVAIRLMW